MDVFVTNYIPLALFPILYIGARIYFRQGPVKAEDMDFVSNLAEIEAESWVSCPVHPLNLLTYNDSVDDPPPRNKFEAFWQWLVSGVSVCIYCFIPHSSLRCKKNL